MKIIYFIESLRSGGKERQLLELINGLTPYDDIQAEILVLSYEKDYPIKNNIKINYLIRNFKKDFSVFFRFYNFCKKNNPNIIHTWGSLPSLIAAPTVKLLNIKFVNGMIREAPKKIPKFSEKWFRSIITFTLSDKIVANSKAGLHSYGVSFSKAAIIYNGFNFARIRDLIPRDIMKQQLGIKNDFVIGMVASFTENKDYGTFINAANSIVRNRNDVTFVAVGDGEKLERCKNMVNPAYKSKIKFLGKRNDVESLVNIFDIGVLSTFTEGLSNSIMEYMALGKPVVATNNPGNKELIKNNINGLLVKEKDALDLEKSIIYLLDNIAISLAMGKKGKEILIKNFSLEHMTNTYVSMYKELF